MMKNLVYKYNIDNHEEVNKKLLNVFNSIPEIIHKGITFRDDYNHCSSGMIPDGWKLEQDSWEENIQTYPHIEYKKILLDAISNGLHEHARFHIQPKITNKDYKLNILNMWYHQMTEGDALIWHNHQNCQWSAIYFLEVPDQKYTQFINPNTQEIINPEVKDGDMIIFPSWLLHRAPKILNKMKTVIVWNMDIII